jgi:hypothetical protein
MTHTKLWTFSMICFITSIITLIIGTIAASWYLMIISSINIIMTSIVIDAEMKVNKNNETKNNL